LEFNDKILLARRKSILEILGRLNVKVERRGSVSFCRSPSNRDSEASLVIYPTSNIFIDYSSGVKGDSIVLYRHFTGKSFVDAVDELCDMGVKTNPYKPKPVEEYSPPFFDITNYLSSDREAISNIDEYASKRKIKEKYIHCHMYGFNTQPAIGFVHTNKYGTVCGLKMRSIQDYGQRYIGVGRLMYYVLDNISDIDTACIYFSESETSSNSLYSFLKENNVNCVVISGGGWSSTPIEPPIKYQCIKERYIIIDFDGSEELYQERLKRFNKNKYPSIKIPLKKGEDINSLYISGEIDNYKQLIINGRT
jgi:hypothetical protein